MNLIQRVKSISLNPRTEWEVIAPEVTTPSELYIRYIIPLAAIGPVASFVGMSVFGISIPFLGTYRMPLVDSLSLQLTSYVLALVSVYLLALLINALVPTFGGQQTPIQALKLATYAYTPAWVAGVFLLLPALGILALLAALYSLYLFYTGVVPMMKVPQEKAVGFTAVTVVCAIVLMIVAGALTNLVGGSGAAPFTGGRGF